MAFHGFPKGGLAFFAELAHEQDRDWFKAHKAEYETLWATPMQELFQALQGKLKGSFPKVGAPKHFRIYRDVRFGKDKSPFKTWVGAVLPLYGGDALGGTGLYAQFGRESFVAAGRWMLEGAQLSRYREAVAGTPGQAFAKAVAKATKAGFELMAHEALKRVPAPFPAEHPRGELLRLKGFAVRYPALRASLLGSGKLVDSIVAQTKAVTPLLAWVERAVR